MSDSESEIMQKAEAKSRSNPIDLQIQISQDIFISKGVF